jgi:hypothetical protein
MKTFCVIYRMGGTDYFTWHRSLAFATREAAFLACANVQHMGYLAHVEDYARSMAIGLPETFGYRIDRPLVYA